MLIETSAPRIARQASDSVAGPKILIAEDDQGNLIALNAILAASDREVVQARSGWEVLSRARQTDFACVVLDASMPDLAQTVTRLKADQRTSRIPFIVIAAYGHDELQIASGHGFGAIDYVFKPINPKVLRSKVDILVDLYRKTEEVRRLAENEKRLLLENLRIQKEKTAAEQRLRDREEHQSLMLQSLPIALYTATVGAGLRRLRFTNDSIRRLSGFSSSDFLRQPNLWEARLSPEEHGRVIQAFADIEKAGSASIEYRWRCADGTEKYVFDHAVLSESRKDGSRELVGFWLDVSDRKSLETGLLHASKLEAVGRLTGGIVHDFRNMLSVVIGTRSDVRWHAAPVGTKQLAETIGILRCGLDEGAWTDKTQTPCAEKLGRQPGAGEQLPFDLERAFALYQALFEPVAKDIEGKELILVPSGPLATLPFQVLLTEKPAAGIGRPDLAKAPWLVKRFATTVLPSVSSLKALRQIAQRSKAPKSFLGVGNPLLNGDAQSASDAERARQARLLQSCERPEVRTNQLAQRGRRSVTALSGGTADVEQLKRQAPLPETALELCAVANSFTPVKGEVYLGNEATEAKLKSLSESGRLEQYRILHFATHGALSGQVQGSVEPGLILTPPATASPADDGYLSSSEISGFKLNADWVVLSACNTAGGDASNSEAFSGLARAFFYAGARALLVSHWPVRSDAAVAITTGAIDAMKSHTDIGRAEGLRRSLSALIAKGGEYAHPSAWAPFVLVGNGSP